MSCVQPRGKAAAPHWAWVSVEASQRELWAGECPDCGTRTQTHSDVDDQKCVLQTRATLNTHGVQFLIALMRRTIYVWEIFFSSFCGTSVQTKLGAAYLLYIKQSLSPSLFSKFYSNLELCTRVHECISMFVQQTFYGSCLSDKRDSVENARRKHACVRSP